MNAPTAAASRLGPDRGAIDAIVAGTHGDPFTVLGPHDHAGRTEIRAFLPRAGRVWAIGPSGGEPLVELERMHPHGFFSGAMPNGSPGGYRLRIESGDTFEIDDPYRFPPILGEMDVYLLAEGRHLRLYEKLGAHPRVMEGVEGTAFTVWAPDARRVSVVGPFNDWDGRRHVMRKRVECGVWEMFIPGLRRGEVYKFEIVGASGELLPLKADPMAFRAEHPPATASVIEGPAGFSWADEAWMQRRHEANALTAPITIYECHLGSWMRVPEDGDRYLSYEELADRLVAYVKEMSFTHVQLMPVSEFPFDGSWGYQPISLYAPTSRHGDPAGFARMVERFHAEGIGVMVDWVPGHFPTDAHGLGRFDGTALYEHADPRKGFHQDWNTLIYNYGRNEVANFLHANALYWLERFHIDGLRVDAVASMLYLDYSRKADEWVPNQFGGNENLEAVAFLRRMNELAFGESPGATTVAEESTSWPSVSRPTYLGGLGFGYKWNMGWMHDTLNYMSKESVHRKFHQNDLTFGLLYAFSENFVLPLSHDEVVHGKGSLLNKMPGDRWQKFANLRAYFGFMWGHPGKKLLFMGGEFGQEREWNHDRSLDWHLIDDPMHGGLQRLVRDLNRIYRAIGALHERDCDHTGFEWIDASDSEQSVISFLRKGADPSKYVVVVSNFTPVVREGYRVGVPRGGAHVEVINTDFEGYGGSNVSGGHAVEAEHQSWHGREFSLRVTLPPLATVFLRSP